MRQLQSREKIAASAVAALVLVVAFIAYRSTRNRVPSDWEQQHQLSVDGCLELGGPALDRLNKLDRQPFDPGVYEVHPHSATAEPGKEPLVDLRELTPSPSPVVRSVPRSIAIAFRWMPCP